MPPLFQATLFGPHLGIGNPVELEPTIAAYFSATRTDDFVRPVLDEMAIQRFLVSLLSDVKKTRGIREKLIVSPARMERVETHLSVIV
jgi:hypothetical protein